MDKRSSVLGESEGITELCLVIKHCGGIRSEGSLLGGWAAGGFLWVMWRQVERYGRTRGCGKMAVE